MRQPVRYTILLSVGLAVCAPEWSVAGEEESGEPAVDVASEEEEADGRPPPMKRLGKYERRAVRRVLRREEWRVERDPEGKRVASVEVATLPVFGSLAPGSLRWFNRFHVTTEPDVIRREVLVEEGEVWNASRVRETQRNLRSSAVLSVAAIVPVVTADPETVRLLVVTRDIWSLRPGFNFEFQNGLLTNLFLFLAENNIAGRHKSLRLAYDLSLGSIEFGPQYYDPALFGTQWELYSRVRAVLTRSTGAYEGTISETTLEYPLWNLRRTWGGELTLKHRDLRIRKFRGPRPIPYDDPRTTAEESVPFEYRSRQVKAEGLVKYAVGDQVKHRLVLGYRFQIQAPTLPEGFPSDPGLRSAFRRDVLPRRERLSGPFMRYFAFVPEFETYRNISTYELSEELSVGPYFRVELSPVLKGFGSTSNFLGANVTVGGRKDIAGDGYVLAEASGRGRLSSRGLYDAVVQGRFELASPKLFRAARVVARAELDAFFEDGQNRIVLAGGETGLRGYRVGRFAGTRRMLGNLEIRSMPLSFGAFELGALAFWDVGHAADRFADLRFRNDVGVGLRLVVPQVQTKPVRLDWAFPLDPGRRAWPGRISVGFGQLF